MSESSPSTCPRCGAPLSGSSVEGLCPRCLLAMNLAEPTRLTGDETLPAKSPIPPISPEKLAPHFPQLEILECLGRGGMGVVYKARQKSLNRLVALKLLAPERSDDAAFTARFEREAHALAALSHPNIVTVHDYGQAGGFCYLLMEFVDGVNLRQAMKGTRFTPEQALSMVPPICEALQYAHEHGIVHRDIKPENVLLDKDGRVKIADFGVAKIVARQSLGEAAAEEPVGHPQATLPAGTPAYMAPEQSTDPARVDHRADIYSLGVVLYEMLTGELPKGNLERPSSHAHGVQIDVRLDEIVLRALETAPELRFQTATDFRTQLQTVVATSHGARDMRVPLKAARTFFTTPEFLATLAGGFWIQQGRGEIALHADRLVFSTAWQRTEIPFTALRELRLVRYPFRANPGGLQAVAITHEDGGQLKKHYFTPAESWFGNVGTVNERVAEWFVAIREAIRASTGTLPPGAEDPPQVVKGISMGTAMVLAPLVAAGFAGFAGLITMQASYENAWLPVVVVAFLLIAAFLIAAFILRSRSGAIPGPAGTGVIPPASGPTGTQTPQAQLYAAMGFRSKWALRCLKLSWFGFLGFLGFLGALPGWQKMWGFTGFFGFFGFLGVATLIELFRRRRDNPTHPAMRTRWHKIGVGILLAAVIALPVYLFLLQVFVIPTDSASPELPRGSRLLVWKLVRDFAPGDMIVYHAGDKALVARVVKVGDKELIVRRNKTGEFAVSREKVIGKVILNTRSSNEPRDPEAPASKTPSDLPAVPPPVPSPAPVAR